MTVIAGSGSGQDPTQHAHHQHNRHSIATTSPRPAILSNLHRARSPSPTWTDDSAASSRIALNLSNDVQAQREVAAAGGLGFSRRLSGPSMPPAQSQGYSPTATDLTHTAAHDLPSFIDLAITIAQSKAIANGSQAQSLLNHPPPRQGEFNYAVTLSNAAVRLSNALTKHSKHQTSQLLPGKLLMAHIHRLVMAQGSSINASEDDARCLREAVKFLLVLSETQISVLRKSWPTHGTSTSGSGSGSYDGPPAMSARPRSPSTTSPLSSPKARVLRALSSSSANTSNHGHSTATQPEATTGSFGSAMAGGIPPHSPSQHSHSLLFSDVAPPSSATQWNPFKRPSLPDRIEPSSSSPLHDAQQIINQLLSERRLLQEEIRGLARSQEESLRGEREKVIKLEGKLQQWKSAFKTLTGTESDDDQKTDTRSTQEPQSTSPHKTYMTEPTSNTAVSPLLQAPRSEPSDMLRPSFESFASSSRQTDGGVSTSGFSYGSGSFSPAAASSGNNTPARGLNGLPRLADVSGFTNADPAGEEDAENDATPRVQSIASGCTVAATTREGKHAPFSRTEPSPRLQSPRSPSSEEEDEVFADTAEQFEGEGEADLDGFRGKHADDGTASMPASETLLFPQYSLASNDAHRRPSNASTSIAPEDRRWSHASASTNSMSQEGQLTPFDRRHSRASTNLTSPSVGSSHHPFNGTKGFSSQATGQRTRDRHSLPPQAPQPTSPLPDVPVGIVSGTCSPVQRTSSHGHAGPAWLMHRSISDDQGTREDRNGSQSSFAGSTSHSGSGVIPLGLGFSHTLERSEDDFEGAFESAPSTLSKSTSVPLSLYNATQPQIPSVAANDYAKATRAPVMEDGGPAPTSTSSMPAAIAEEEGDAEKGSLQESANLSGSSASALQDFRDRVEADILLEPTPRSNAGHSAKRGFKSLFKRDHNKQDSVVVTPSTPSSARSYDAQLSSRPRGMTTSSLLSNGQSADTHATTAGSSGNSHDTTAFEGVGGAASAATSISDASSEQPGKSGRPASSRRSNGSRPTGLTRSTSSAAASIASQQTTSSMSSEARQQKQQKQQQQQQQQQQKRRELDLMALGITSPPIEHRSKYNRGSRSRILGHTSSLTNLKGTDGNRAQRAGPKAQQQPAQPQQHPHSFMLSKDTSLSTRYGAPTPNRRRTNSSVSHDAGMMLDSQANGRTSASDRQSAKKLNGGYGYVGNHQHEKDVEEADASEDEQGSEGEEDEKEDEEEDEAAGEPSSGAYNPPKYPSIHASSKGNRPASAVSVTSLSSQSKPERSPQHSQEQAQAAASRRLKFSKR